jgi:hypothetical protein
MRTQFQTLESSTSERPIIQYQAVSSKIVDGFATLISLSYLRQRLITMPIVNQYMRSYFPFLHQVIL